MNLTHPAYSDIRLSPIEGDPHGWRLMVNFNRVDRRCLGFVYRDPKCNLKMPTYTNSSGKKEFRTKKAAAEDLLNVGVFRG